MTGKLITILLFLLFFYGNQSSPLNNDRSLCASIINNIPATFISEEMANDCKPYLKNEKYTARDTRTPSFNLKQSIFSNRMLFDQLRDSIGNYRIFQKFKNHVDASGRNRYHPAFTKTGFERMIKKTTVNKYKKQPSKKNDDLIVFEKRNDLNGRFQRSESQIPEGFSYDFVRFGKRDPVYIQKNPSLDNSLEIYKQFYKKSEDNKTFNFRKEGEQDKRGVTESNNYDFVRFG